MNTKKNMENNKRKFDPVICGLLVIILLIMVFAPLFNKKDNVAYANQFNNITFIRQKRAEAYMQQIASNIIESQFKKPEKKQVPKIAEYIVQRGDSYWKISQNHYNDGKYYVAIAEYNKRNVYEVLYSGTLLKLPELADEEFMKIYKSSSTKYANRSNGTSLASRSSNSSQQRSSSNNNTSSSSSNGKFDQSTEVAAKNYTGEVDTSNMEYLGEYKITGYVPTCAHCCGKTNGIGASGAQIQPGYSVAAPKGLAFGTKLYIQGYGYYVVQDRGGFGNNVIDVACSSHHSCNSITARGIKVYIVND